MVAIGFVELLRDRRWIGLFLFYFCVAKPEGTCRRSRWFLRAAAGLAGRLQSDRRSNAAGS